MDTNKSKGYLFSIRIEMQSHYRLLGFKSCAINISNITYYKYPNQRLHVTICFFRNSSLSIEDFFFSNCTTVIQLILVLLSNDTKHDATKSQKPPPFLGLYISSTADCLPSILKQHTASDPRIMLPRVLKERSNHQNTNFINHELGMDSLIRF